jgi:hypothetical protein
MQFADVLTFDQIARLDDIHQFENEQNTRLTHLLKGANEHNRGYCSGSEKERQLTASTWQMMCSAAVAAGLTSFSVETYSYKVPETVSHYSAYTCKTTKSTVISTLPLRHLQCPQCNFTVEPCVQYSEYFGDQTFLTRTLVKDHLMHNPNCQYFDFHKEMCSLPEIFRPDCSVQALLPEYNGRKQAFMQQLTEAGYMGFNQESPAAERDSAPVFNYWTGSYFRCATWQALVPACTFEPA